MAETFLNGKKRKVDAHIWARGKSMDHADCNIRLLTERGSRLFSTYLMEDGCAA
jgi:hypothetical protein